jgi:hypothetical protein
VDNDFLHKLPQQGIRSIREYILLLTQGGNTILQRRFMVQEYIDDLHSQMANLQSALALTEKK